MLHATPADATGMPSCQSAAPLNGARQASSVADKAVRRHSLHPTQNTTFDQFDVTSARAWPVRPGPQGPGYDCWRRTSARGREGRLSAAQPCAAGSLPSGLRALAPLASVHPPPLHGKDVAVSVALNV